jgi:hypothetical protein
MVSYKINTTAQVFETGCDLDNRGEGHNREDALVDS